jgi:hypothetical protein
MKGPGLSVAGLLIIVLIGVATCLRFVSPSQSPPGFYRDEAATSAQVICVQQSGQNLRGQSLPLFTEVLGRGYLTPSYLYPAAAWTFVFGDSISSFRSFTAFFSLLFIFGSFLLGLRVWQNFEAAWLCALSAALSPWAFQFARIAWDPSLAPAYMVWAFALLWAVNKKYRWLELATSGILFSVAAYCYPPVRVQLAIMFPFAIAGLVFVYNRDWRHYLIPIATSFIVATPLLKKTLTGEIQSRFEMLSVFNKTYLTRVYGSATAWHGFHELLKNFGLLLSPTYLLLTGDANLRHSTGSLGVWSWLDGLGIFAALVTLFLILFQRTKLKIAKFEVSFVVAGYLAGILPAALTWESNPHALRSFGAVTFLVLAVGGGLRLLWSQSRSMRSAVVGVAFVTFLLFTHVYFVDYPKIAGPWFDAQISQIAMQLQYENRLQEMSKELKARGIYDAPMAVAYYQLAGGALRCPIKTRLDKH